MHNGDMILTTSVKAMIESREIIREKILAGITLLDEACAIEKATSLERYSVLESFITSGRAYHYDVRDPQATADAAMKHVDARFWSALMNQSGIRAFMSAKRQGEFDTMIGEAKTPTFELNTIKATFAELYEKRADMMEEGVLDLFKRLSWDYRTNNPVRIGRKIIVERLVNDFGSVNMHTTNMLDDLVRILSVYDGQPIPEHRHGMYALITDGPLRFNNEVDAEYFHLKVYKKGTGHITFTEKALPLLDQCNRVIARMYPNALPEMKGRAA